MPLGKIPAGAIRIISQMDQGHGLLDRFLFLFPVCLQPSTAETEMAHSWFQSEEMPQKQVSDIFLEMYDFHDHNTPSYCTFSEKSTQNLTTLQDDFIWDVNDAIREGNMPPNQRKLTCCWLSPSASTCLSTPLLNYCVAITSVVLADFFAIRQKSSCKIKLPQMFSFHCINCTQKYWSQKETATDNSVDNTSRDTLVILDPL